MTSEENLLYTPLSLFAEIGGNWRGKGAITTPNLETQKRIIELPRILKRSLLLKESLRPVENR